MKPENSKPGLGERFLRWSAEHPIGSILLVSLVAVVINCYPVVFCGRTFASPGLVPEMVYGYGQWPDLPDAPANLQRLDHHQSDTADMMWQNVPLALVESRSILKHGELPLWDRYVHAGTPLLGQAVSMLGDPLQWIVIFGRGAAWAWDIKYLTAKFLFCVGFGLLIRRLAGDHKLTLLYSVLAAYCGAYFYIEIHAVYFVFAYAPWVLLTALEFLAASGRRRLSWGLGWVAANYLCFNGGHMEVAVETIAELNLVAVAHALWRSRRWADVWRMVAQMGVGTLLFLGLTAPMWVSFLVLEEGAYSMHMQVSVHQNMLINLPCFFDIFGIVLWQDAFYTLPTPGCSLLLLPGIIYAAWQWRRLKAETFFWINSAVIVVLFVFIYLPITGPILAAIPWLNRVDHISVDFSYLLIIHLTIQSAYGFRCLIQEHNFARAATRFLWIGLGLVSAMLFYCGWLALDPKSWVYVFGVIIAAAAVPCLYAYHKSRSSRISPAGWLGIAALAAITLFHFGYYHAGNDAWKMVLGPRVVLNAPSPAIQKIQAQMSEPCRVAGLRYILWGDCPAIYGLEDIRSVLPLSNLQYTDLVGHFPGLDLFTNDWQMPLEDPVKAQPLLNLLNVRYVLDAPGVGWTNNPGWRLVDRSDFTVLENLQVWPRAFFTDRIIQLASNKDFVQYLLGHGRQPFVALTPEEMEKKPALSRLETTDPAGTTVTPATHYELGVNATAFDIHAPSAGVVCLTEEQAKDFTVQINGRSGQVLTVNRAFKGVYLEQPGDYHIVFTYRPRYWRAACLAFLVSIFSYGLLAMMAFSRFIKSRDSLTNGEATHA